MILCKYIWILVCLAVLTIPVTACPYSGGPFYIGFTVMQRNSSVPDGWTVPGTNNQLFDPVPNAVILATPTEPYIEPWILWIIGINEHNPPLSELHAQLGITDENGFVGIPLYHSLKYNLTIIRENQPNKHFLIIPSDINYILYLGD